MAKERRRKTTSASTGKKGMPAGRVLDPARAISYAREGIVSRTLLENRAGTVTLFAFAAGQGLSEHTAPFDALVHVLDGQGQFIVGGKSNTVRTGCALLMPANVPHAVQAPRRFKMLLTMLRAKKKSR